MKAKVVEHKHRVIALELSSAGREMNRIIVEHRQDPRLKAFVDVLDSEDAHSRLLQEC